MTSLRASSSSVSKVRKDLEQYTLTNKLSYNEVQGYVGDHFSSDQSESGLYAMHSNVSSKKHKFDDSDDQSQSNQSKRWKQFGFKRRSRSFLLEWLRVF